MSPGSEAKPVSEGGAIATRSFHMDNHGFGHRDLLRRRRSRSQRARVTIDTDPIREVP